VAGQRPDDRPTVPRHRPHPDLIVDQPQRLPAGEAATGSWTPSAAHSGTAPTAAASTTVWHAMNPLAVSTPITAPSRTRSRRISSPSRICAPWRRAASTSATVTATGSTAPSPGRYTARDGGVRRFGSSRAISSASTSRSSGPSGSVSSPQASDPIQSTETPATSRSSLAQSSPRIQANDSPVTPEAGRDRSTSTTLAPSRAA
jgi:hypothetical protein